MVATAALVVRAFAAGIQEQRIYGLAVSDLEARASLAADAAPDTSAGVTRREWWRRRSARRGALGLGVVLVLALVAAIVITNIRISSRPDLSTSSVNAIARAHANSAVSALESQPPTAASVYSVIRASLVVVVSERSRASATSELGTGFFVDAAGDIMTALHVVKNATRITVTFADGTTSPATIKSADATNDIAVLTPKRLPTVVIPAVLGGGAIVGDEAFAVGNPLGLVGSLSAGVISGVDRTFSPAGGPKLSGLIQFDAAVNPGSSGGPLLNTKGQVIGIVTGLANPSGNDAFSGIGFAVPIATAGGAAGAPPK